MLRMRSKFNYKQVFFLYNVIKHQIDNSIEYNTIFSFYITVYIYYMFIVFTEAKYLMTDEPP